MTEDDIAVIRRSWLRIAPRSGIVAEVFYNRLFLLAPETRALFQRDLGSQQAKFMVTLAAVVDALSEQQTLESKVRDLAMRHVGYGVDIAHYQPVGAALIETLSECDPAGFGARERHAWSAAYERLAGWMVDEHRRSA